jgi:Flp pilus assembly secretin CpaC
MFSPVYAADASPAAKRRTSFQSPSRAASLDAPIDVLEFRDAELTEAMRVFTRETGINVIASPKAAETRVTLYLEDVAPLAAMEVLAKSHRLWYRYDQSMGTIFIYSHEERSETAPDPQVLAQQINESFPDSHVELSLVGDKLVVRGQAKDALEAEHIIRIVSESALPARHAADEPTVNVNLSRVEHFPGILNRRGSAIESRAALTDVLQAGRIAAESRITDSLGIGVAGYQCQQL